MSDLVLKRAHIDMDLTEPALIDLLNQAEAPCFHLLVAPRLAFEGTRLLQRLRKHPPANLAEARFLLLDLLIIHAWPKTRWGVAGEDIIVYTEEFA
jgi:hypothetical protein